MPPTLNDNTDALDLAAWLGTVRGFADTWPAGILTMGGEAPCLASPAGLSFHSIGVAND